MFLLGLTLIGAKAQKNSIVAFIQNSFGYKCSTYHIKKVPLAVLFIQKTNLIPLELIT